jgi:hypothetical protein
MSGRSDLMHLEAPHANDLAKWLVTNRSDYAAFNNAESIEALSDVLKYFASPRMLVSVLTSVNQELKATANTQKGILPAGVICLRKSYLIYYYLLLCRSREQSRSFCLTDEVAERGSGIKSQFVEN